MAGSITLIGLDLGTQGVRAIATTPAGKVLASASERYQRINAAEDPLKEQVPADWRAAAYNVLADVSAQLRAADALGDVILGIDGTSGTVVPLDAEGTPLTNALMYNDARSKPQVAEVHAVCAALEDKLGYLMGSSFALPKICWIRDEQPDVFARTATFAHQTDYLVGCLTGNFRVTDYSNALKTGYDLIDERWPIYEFAKLGLDASLFAEVVRPGAEIGTITSAAAEATGLPAGTRVVAGATDGYSSCVATGAVEAGQFNSTIGTTLILKGVTSNFIKDPEGRIYCHKHPEGLWYPGGAGNVGGLCLNEWFGEGRFEMLNKTVPELTPTGALVYPLTTTGERFPFVRPDAEGFALAPSIAMVPQYPDRAEAYKAGSMPVRYAATMEGVAYVERLCFDTLAQLGCEVGDEITIAGGAAKAPVWSQVRANVLGKRLVEPANVEAAFGTAVMAGTVLLERTLTESAREMVQISRSFEPEGDMHDEYDGLYEEFCGECRSRGWID